jgi:SAM-dependent methyltransferase
MTNSYERVSAEYYDAQLHPTCHNLRVGSEFGLRRLLSGLATEPARYLELGAGASLAIDSRFNDATVVCVDLNPGMLAHSTAGLCVVADAFMLPSPPAAFDGVFGSLIDPFNVPALYNEVRRVLRPGGRFAFTVPDVTWVRVNQATDELPLHSAGITLQTGETVVLASYVWSYAEQERHLREAGFCDVRRIDVPLGIISPDKLSRRFLSADGKPAFEWLVSAYEAA